MTITSRTAPAVLRHRLRTLPPTQPDPVVLVPERDADDYCRCGHTRAAHGPFEGPCGAVQPDRCSCRGFRYGRRSGWAEALGRWA